MLALPKGAYEQVERQLGDALSSLGFQSGVGTQIEHFGSRKTEFSKSGTTVTLFWDGRDRLVSVLVDRAGSTKQVVASFALSRKFTSDFARFARQLPNQVVNAI